MLNKGENSIKFSIFIVGLTTVITQIILLRHFLSVFSGNELVIGIILANWMLLTAVGAYLARFKTVTGFNTRVIFLSHILLGLLPLIIAYFSFTFRNMFFPPGKMLNLLEIFFSSLILLAPFCILSGYLFTLFSTLLSKLKESNDIHKVYGVEAIGSMVGGLLFNFVFIFVFNTFFSLKILLFINFGAALFLYFSGSETRLPKLFGIIAIALAGLAAILNIGELANEQLFKNQTILDQRDTPYGNITVTESSGQLNFYENGQVIFSTDDIITNEENVHYAMLQHRQPENILVISGGVSGVMEEILKYDVASIDYVEINPELIKIAGNYLNQSSTDKTVNIINQDARLFLKKINKNYDVILINLPDPSSVYLNRYYSLEFFEEIKKKLSYSGIVSTSLSSSANYMGKESREYHTALFSTMKLIFNNVIIIPGQKNFFIASDNKLSNEIGSLSKHKNINSEYVNHYYIDDELIAERRDKIESEISEGVAINYDFFPITYVLQIKLWLSKFNFEVLLIVLVLLVIAFVIIPRLHIVNLGLFSTGFSATSLEVLFLIAFQIIYGYIYFMLGIFITVFMLGIVLGSLWISKKIKISYKNYSFIQYLIGILAIIAPIIIINLSSGQPGSFIVHSVFTVLMLVVGILTGVQFTFGSNLRYASILKTASGSYSADLLGSAFGAILVVTVLIPLFGLIKVCLIIGILNFITGLIILIKTRNQQ